MYMHMHIYMYMYMYMCKMRLATAIISLETCVYLSTHFVDEFECFVMEVVGKSFHHIGASPWVSHLREAAPSPIARFSKFVGCHIM